MSRILHVITGLREAGAERSLFNLLQGDFDNGVDHHVVSLGGSDNYGARMAALGVSVTCLNLKRRGVCGVARYLKLLKDWQPDVIQGWMYHGNLAASFGRALAARRAALAWNIRHALHDFTHEKPATRAVIRTGAPLSGRPGGIIYNSHLARAQHEARGFAAGAGRVIVNGFDSTEWRPDPVAAAQMRHRLGLTPQDRVIGFVGRHHPLKDVPTLLAALARILTQDSKVHAVLVGDGLNREQDALAQLPAGQVHLLGQRPDVPDLMRCFDVLCLSSRSEAFPNVIGEAMASAVPCVATDVGDVARVIGDTGVIVPPRDPSALAAGLRRMLALSGSDRRQLGLQARQRIICRYSLTATTGQYRQVYETLLERRR